MLVLVYILGKTPNNLLDIGKDMDKPTGRGKVFYDDQVYTRESRLRKDTDKVYELEVQTKQIAAAEAQTCEDNKVFHVLVKETDKELSNDEDATLFLLKQSNDTTLNFNVSLNQSGLGRYVTSTNKTGYSN